MTKKTRNITINEVVTKYEEMKDVSRDLSQDINTIYCSYVRQPIHSVKKDGFYQIDGTCALTGEKCYRFVDEHTQFKVDWCEYYKNYFKKGDDMK